MVIAEKLQQTSDELGSETSILQIPFLNKEKVIIKQRNFVVIQTVKSSSNSFILGHPTNGKMGVANGLGGSQIVLGATSGDVTNEVIRRRYDWETQDDFNRGTRSDNIDIRNDAIQLGNVIVRNIFIEHKSK